MALRFLCPNCRRELEVPDEAAGTAGSCRLCGAAIVAPAMPGAAAAMKMPPAAPTAGAAATPTAWAPRGRLEPAAIVAESWRLLWANFGPIAVSTYVAVGLMVLIYFVAALPVSLIEKVSIDTSSSSMYTGIITAALYLVLAPLVAAPLYVAHEMLCTGQARLSSMLHGFRQYRSLVVFNVFYNAIPTITLWLIGQWLTGAGPAGEVGDFIVTCIVSLVLLATIYPGIMEIVDRDADGVSALKSSWEFTKGHRWTLLLTWILLALAIATGALACGIGLLATLPLWPVAAVLVYRDLCGLRGGVNGVVPKLSAKTGAGRGHAGTALALAGCGALVISILAAIVFPAFAKGRLNAQQALCLKHMSNQGMALRLYAGDHDNRLPVASRWEDAIQPYLHDATDGCPVASSGSGYVFNAAMGGQPLPKGPAAATTVLLFDGGGGGRNVAGGAGAPVARHGNNATIGYADGHVRTVTRGDLGRLQWAPPAP